MFFRRKNNLDGLDLMILGGGSAAFAAAIRASELGARVALAEEGLIGGTCVNRGCLPTKNLLHAAERYHQYARNSFPGLPAGREQARFREVIRQKDELVEHSRKSKYWDILEAYPGIQYYPHRARFLSPHEVEVDGKVIRAGRFILATGASPAPLPIEGMDRVDSLTYQEALELQEPPASLVVIGGGPIGLELGQFFARFGCRVTILEALPHIAPNEEEEISTLLEGYLREEGIEILTGARVQRVGRRDGQVVILAEAGGQKREFLAEKLLLAAGLKPNTAGLGLEAAGVEVDRRGAVVVDATLRTTARQIWAAGDVTGQLMLVTVAAHQGIVATENALRKKGRRAEEISRIPHAIFTSPQVASVGLKEKEARERGLKVKATAVPFEWVPKAAAMRDPRGLIKLVAEEGSYRILGVHLLCHEAADLIMLGTLAVRHGLTVGDLIRSLFVYPTLSEAYKLAALAFKKDITRLSCCAE